MSVQARPPLVGFVDRPIFWWSAGAIFFLNACLSAAAGHWVMGVLQALTSLWAGVAAVTAGHAALGYREPTDGTFWTSEGAHHSS